MFMKSGKRALWVGAACSIWQFLFLNTGLTAVVPNLASLKNLYQQNTLAHTPLHVYMCKLMYLDTYMHNGNHTH